MHVNNPTAVIPFLDRYLETRVKKGQLKLDDTSDAQLRHCLQQDRLGEILTIQEQERSSVYRTGRFCLFCNTHLPSYPELFSHMFQTHSFNIGQLNNLVMVREFLDTLQAKLDRRICIYCDGTFPSMPTLKKHLKNKSHYKINPDNHAYDKFYIVNYLQPGVLHSQSRDEPAEAAEEGKEDEEAAWDGLKDIVDEKTMCLLCLETMESPNLCVDHMRKMHGFDWDGLVAKGGLDDYEIIKLINYIRCTFSELNCIYCQESLTDEQELKNHLEQHHRPYTTLPSRILWNATEYLFPTFEDDPLLCYLSDMKDSNETTT